MGFERRGGLIPEDDIQSLGDTLFTKAVEGSGEANDLSFQQVEAQAEDAPRQSPLLLRPEAYEVQLTGRAKRLDERGQALDERSAALDEREAACVAQEEALAQREEQVEELVLAAVEEQVDRRASETLESERARLVSSVTQLEAITGGLLDQARVDLLELSVKISERILGAELKTRPQLLVGLIRSALEAAQLTGAITLNLSPKDHALLRSKGPQVLGNLPKGLKLQLKADPALKRGDVVIESSAGRLDATLQARLQRVGSSLAELTGEP